LNIWTETKMKKTIILLVAFLLTACFEVPEIPQQPPTPAPPTATPLILQATPTLAPPPTATEEPTQSPESASLRIPAPEFVQIAMFDEQNGWAQDEESLYRTADGGQTWQAVLPPRTDNDTYLNVAFLDEQTAYLISAEPQNPPGLFAYTRDGGQTWAQANVPFTFARLVVVNDLTLYAFEDLGAAAGSQGIALYQSLDGGQNWVETFAHVPGETQGASLPFGGQKSLPAFLDAALGYIGGARPVENEIYFYRTADAGRTWQSESLPVPPEIKDYMALTDSPITFAGNVEQLIVPVHFSLFESDPLLVFFTSLNRGQTWQPSSALPYANTYQFLDPQTGWAWADGVLYATLDGGQIWQALPKNLPDGVHIAQINFVNPQTGWLLVFDQDFQNVLYTTADGGQTWQKLSP
jgi:uncharacterized protein (DUF2141 family)